MASHSFSGTVSHSSPERNRVILISDHPSRLVCLFHWSISFILIRVTCRISELICSQINWIILLTVLWAFGFNGCWLLGFVPNRLHVWFCVSTAEYRFCRLLSFSFLPFFFTGSLCLFSYCYIFLVLASIVELSYIEWRQLLSLNSKIALFFHVSKICIQSPRPLLRSCSFELEVCGCEVSQCYFVFTKDPNPKCSRNLVSEVIW